MEWRFLAVFSRKLTVRYTNFTLVVRKATSLSFKHYGDSLEPDDPAVLLLHGLLGNRKQWDGVGKTLSNLTKRTVIALDLRNHGRSPHMPSHNYVEMAEDVQLLIQKQGVEKAILLGHSMGGRVAMSLALMQPTLITGIIVVDISPVSSSPTFVIEYPKILDEMRKISFDNLESKKVRKAQKHAKKQLKKFVKEDSTMASILSNINFKRDGTIGWTCNLDVLISHYKYIAAFPKSLLDMTYSGPVMFIGGQLSDFLPPDDLPRIREIFPNSTITYIPQTDHRPYIQNQKKFLELVLSFVKNNGHPKIL